MCVCEGGGIPSLIYPSSMCLTDLCGGVCVPVFCFFSFSSHHHQTAFSRSPYTLPLWYPFFLFCVWGRGGGAFFYIFIIITLSITQWPPAAWTGYQLAHCQSNAVLPLSLSPPPRTHNTSIWSGRLNDGLDVCFGASSFIPFVLRFLRGTASRRGIGEARVAHTHTHIRATV